jgi:hypothetical protein
MRGIVSDGVARKMIDKLPADLMFFFGFTMHFVVRGMKIAAGRGQGFMSKVILHIQHPADLAALQNQAGDLRQQLGSLEGCLHSTTSEK